MNIINNNLGSDNMKIPSFPKKGDPESYLEVTDVLMSTLKIWRW